MKKLLGILLIILLAVGCSSAPAQNEVKEEENKPVTALEGEYKDDEGLVHILFKEGNLADVTLFGGTIEKEYVIEDHTIKVVQNEEPAGISLIDVSELKANDDFSELTLMNDDGTPTKVVLKKVK